MGGMSHVNIELFKEFSIGQSKLVQGQCKSAREQKENIENLMLVPLIQGTLRYAWKTQAGEVTYSEKAEAEGVIFAASVLPAVYACDPDAAATIEDSMVAGQSNTADFGAVKSAFESTYECMGVNPDHVGGLYDAATGQYYEGAEPMNADGGDGSSSSARGSSLGTAATAVASVLFGAVVASF